MAVDDVIAFERAHPNFRKADCCGNCEYARILDGWDSAECLLGNPTFIDTRCSNICDRYSPEVDNASK